MKLVHIWSYIGTPSANDQRRMDVAQATWGQFDFNRKIVLEKSLNSFPSAPRDSTSIGDKHTAWFVRYILYEGRKDLGRHDFIVLSNADLYFMPGAADVLRTAIEKYGCCWTRRRDFQQLPIAPEYSIKDGAEYPGPEAFGFDLRWYMDHFQDFPDMIFGRQHWDCCLRLLMRKTGGVFVPDIAAHETHAPQWLSGECNAANLYNERLLCEWIAKNGGSTQDHLYTNEELGFR